jgi:large-conductance mechanosensitive channel
MYRKFKIYLIISSIISIGLIVTLTYKVITETHSPQFFGVDFTNKYNEILSYSALIGTILTFLSIMFILFAILHEKNIYEEQKNEKESKSDEELQDRIILIRNIVSEIKTDISVLSGNMQSFIAEEKKEPHGFNDFLSPLFNNYYELIERDFSIVFKSFQSQFKSENKIEIFNKVFKQVNIYCNLLKEIKEKHKYHVYDKNREQKEILKEFNSLIDFCFIAWEN